MEKDIYLTKEGTEKLKEELEHLIEVERKKVIARIKEARELGDLSENSEYAEARDHQSMIEGRIEEIEETLKKAKVIDKQLSKIGNGSVQIGSKVTCEVKFQDEPGSEKDVFYIVGSAESDAKKGMISAESPMGAALIGAKKGDKREVPVPDDGVVTYKIIQIE